LPEYNQSADFEWLRDNFPIPWLELDLIHPIPVEEIFEEIQKIKPHLVEHRYETGDYDGWYSFCLHGKDHSATKQDYFYNDAREYKWTELALEHMPKTVEFFKTRWPGSDFARVRVMLLNPNGHIGVHRDDYPDIHFPINLAITHPKDCHMVFEKHGAVPFAPGKAFWLNIYKLHAVFNNSDQPRWHMIVHQDQNDPKFQELVVKSYHRLYNSLHESS
jgi:aspartyl/asparaginyl beta-hydroxylase (cupin superfamily)